MTVASTALPRPRPRNAWPLSSVENSRRSALQGLFGGTGLDRLGFDETRGLFCSSAAIFSAASVEVDERLSSKVQRYWSMSGEIMVVTPIPDWGLPGPRSASWCCICLDKCWVLPRTEMGSRHS